MTPAASGSDAPDEARVGPSEGAARERDVTLSDGLVLRVREWRGAGPRLLLIHGFLGSRLAWQELPGRLENVHVVAVDLPGHGRSGGARMSREVTVPGVARVLGELQERVFREPAAWLGYSMGGRIALAAAAEGVPMDRLLLESAGPGLATAAARAARRSQDRERAERLRREGIEAFVDAWLQMPLFQGVAALPSPVRSAARAVRAGQDPARMAAWLEGGGTGSQPDYRSRLADLSLPVHLLAGARDPKYVALAREMAQRLPHARVSVAADVGHTVHLEAPEAWLAWVREALEM